MKIAADIRARLEEEARKLTEAMLSGEVSLTDGRTLCDLGLTEGDVHHLAREVLRYAAEEKLLSVLMGALGSMKWLTLAEAEVYARMDRTTLKRLINDPHSPIYGTRQGDPVYGTKSGRDTKSKIIVDRESIDAHYSKGRNDFLAEIIDQVREGRYG
jgi:hypothetical protein